MSFLRNTSAWIFAQADAAPAPVNPAAPVDGAAEGPSPIPMVMMYAGLGLLFYLFFMRPAQKQAAQQRDRLDALKKGDEVVTKSGIYGTVVSVDKDAKRITLKIDESNNTKIHVTLASIDYMVNDPGASEKSS